MKVCRKCGETKPRAEYSKKAKQGDGLQPRCKSCCSLDTEEWRSRQSPERIRDLYYKRTYGMSLEEFNTIFIKQQGKCPICSKLLSMEHLSGDRAVVDHCHTSGQVRGIICNECNRGLGYFRDNKDALMNAVKYLSGEDLTPKGGQ